MSNRKNGFTLIELIVVIAIIGVLAAILVPAMLGYISKAKITASNAAARDISNAITVALIDLDAQDYSMLLFSGDWERIKGVDVAACKDITGSDVPASTTDVEQLKKLAFAKMYQCFSDVEKVEEFSARITGQACVGVGVLDGRYPGSYPIAIGADDFKAYEGTWTSNVALGYALKDETLYKDAV